MKKTYIQPSIEAVNIQLSQMVMQSVVSTTVFGSGKGPASGSMTVNGHRGDFVEVEFDED